MAPFSDTIDLAYETKANSDSNFKKDHYRSIRENEASTLEVSGLKESAF